MKAPVLMAAVLALMCGCANGGGGGGASAEGAGRSSGSGIEVFGVIDAGVGRTTTRSAPAR